MKSVAARAGVAKTTIHRRHANRADLLTAVLKHAIGPAVQLPEGSVRERIRFALDRAWQQTADVLGPGGLAAMMTDADPEFTELFRAVSRPYDEALVARIRADSSAGLLRTSTSTPTAGQPLPPTWESWSAAAGSRTTGWTAARDDVDHRRCAGVVNLTLTSVLCRQSWPDAHLDTYRPEEHSGGGRTMVTTQFEPGTRRLRIAGPCPLGDRSELSAVLRECAAQARGRLIVDLTAVTSIAPEVARDLVAAACEERARQGGTCVLLRRHGSTVDEVLTEAEVRLRAGSRDDG